MRVTRLAVAAALVALLAAGCAGEPTGGQVEVQSVTSTATEATSTTEPATTRRTGATTRPTITTRRTTTTRGATTESKPAANPVLTVKIDPPAAARVEVSVVNGAVAGTCSQTCTYPQFPKATKVILQPEESRTLSYSYGFGDQAPCDPDLPCEFDLLMDTTVTVHFSKRPGG